jgi:NADH-dependent fumarate reductase subunit B
MNPVVEISVKRSNSNELQTYKVPFYNGMTLLAALRYIGDNLDETLRFRNYHCGRGVCTTCIVKVDGCVKRSCCTPLKAGEKYIVEPANDKVIKDLVVVL